MTRQKTYIVLVNWNGWRDTLLCLESVLRLNHDDYVVVVCDNNSSDQSLEHIKAWCAGEQQAEGGNPQLQELVSPPVPKPLSYVELNRQQAEAGQGDNSRLVFIQTGANLGFAGGNNVGFRYALARGDADYVWALNNDTVVPANALSSMLNHMQAHPRLGLCGSTVRFMMQPQVVQAYGGASYNRWSASIDHIGLGTAHSNNTIDGQQVESRLSYVFGASMLASKPFLEAVGLMQDDYFLFFEELDWAERAKKKGFQLGYAPGSTVYHKAGAATGSAEETPFSLYFLNRNRLKFIKRFYAPYLLLNYPMLWLEVAKALVKGRLPRAKAISCALLGIPLYTPPSPAIKN